MDEEDISVVGSNTPNTPRWGYKIGDCKNFGLVLWGFRRERGRKRRGNVGRTMKVSAKLVIPMVFKTFLKNF